MQKVYDIHGMGIILVELAHWKVVDEILRVPREAPSAAMNARGSLRDTGHLNEIKISDREGMQI